LMPLMGWETHRKKKEEKEEKKEGRRRVTFPYQQGREKGRDDFPLSGLLKKGKKGPSAEKPGGKTGAGLFDFWDKQEKLFGTWGRNRKT